MIAEAWWPGALEVAIARVWPELPGRVTGDWNAFESAVLEELRALEWAKISAAAAEAAGDDGAVDLAQQAIDEAEDLLLRLFAAAPLADDRLQWHYRQTLNEERTRGRGPAGSVQYYRYLEVPVYFATNRKPSEAADKKRAGWYTGERAAGEGIRYGRAKVSVPDRHRQGRVEKPRLWRLGFNPQRRFEILAVDALGEKGFVGDVRAALETSVGGPSIDEVIQRREHVPSADTMDAVGVGDVLVFTHGYNVSFTDAAFRAAQLAYDLNFGGAIMLFSWPSKAALAAYFADSATVRWATPYFAGLLDLAVRELKAREVHAVAHSIGNQVLAGALDRLPLEDTPLGHVIFGAPDIDKDEFLDVAERVARRARRYTMYTSSRDMALKASGRLASHPRAGLASGGIGAGHVDVIDASALNTGPMSHSYPLNHRAVLSDMRDLLGKGQAPPRSGIRAHTDRDGVRYWAFPP
jgi:esterase/lipase superfamily enzyme